MFLGIEFSLISLSVFEFFFTRSIKRTCVSIWETVTLPCGSRSRTSCFWILSPAWQRELFRFIQVIGRIGSVLGHQPIQRGNQSSHFGNEFDESFGNKNDSILFARLISFADEIGNLSDDLIERFPLFPNYCEIRDGSTRRTRE